MAERRGRMRIAAMSCADCEQHVRAALGRAGARDVEADFRLGEVRFVVDEPVDEGALAGAVRAAGYRPLAVEWEEPGGSETGEPAAARPRRGRGEEYDLAVVGSGGAAFAAAIRARERGARVVMVERGTLGGTCVNVGCVPSKTLLRAGEIYRQAGHHPFAGVATAAQGMDMPALVRQKDELVAELRRRKYEELVDAYGWELVRGEASFADAHTLLVEGSPNRAARILVATGARPAVPDTPGLAEAGYLTSTTAPSLDRVPESVAVIGSG
jgi:mercuric reductase